MALLPGIVRSLFSFETSPLRFEQVCIDLYRAAEGVELVPTSLTWDRGRDARSISISTGGQALPGVLCATLSADVDAKVEADIRRLAETTQTKAIVYCTSRPLTEDACDRIETKIRELYHTVESVRVLGEIQLGALGERFEDTLRRHYAAEIQNVEQALLVRPMAAPEPEHIGLRLALITQTGDDASALRSELTRHLVLETLHASGPQNPGRLAVAISGQLHLARSISANYVSQILSQLKDEDLVHIQDDMAHLTPSGTSFVNVIPEEASSRLLEGRAAIREAIKILSGHPLSDEHYEQVWNSLQDGLADLFYSHGAAIVRMVGSLITGERVKPEARERVLLERLGDSILRLFSDPIQGSEVRQAVIDMFSENETEAFRWLTQICSVYVMMCSLGFEAFSSQQVTRVLKSFRLVPDSDIIISLLCEEERNHQEVDRVARGWKALGGKLLLATPVIEEVAYHAWISEHDYTAMVDLLDHISDFDANHLIGNAFVRTFRLVSAGLTDKKYWNRYIGQYRGATEYDYGSVMEIIKDEYGFDRLPDAGEQYNTFAEQMRQFVLNRASENAKCRPEELDYRLQDKCRRDGILVAAVQAARDAVRQSGVSGTTIILSSASLLKEADEVFRKELGKPDAVVSTAALGCLLTLTPGVSMGLGTLRGVLFDLGLAARLTPIERYAYRLIVASGEFDLPWSRRVTLQRELGAKLLEDARARGEPARQIRNRVLKSENPEYSAKIVADALDQMAVTPEAEKELAKAKEEIRKLREELEALKSRGIMRSHIPTTSAGSKRKKRKRRR